jgi:hypothetical protein
VAPPDPIRELDGAPVPFRYDAHAAVLSDGASAPKPGFTANSLTAR